MKNTDTNIFMSGKEIKSSLCPLFWQHGEEESVLREEIARMNEGGVGSFIVESRPHPDFLSFGWWRDLDIILSEAKQRGMDVWIFDDNAYPSGLGAGRIRDLYPESRKRYLSKQQIDAVGPQRGASLQIAPWLGEGDKLIKVIAARRANGNDKLQEETLTDLTDLVKDGLLYWDIPEGPWRIFLLIVTRNGGEEWTKDYVNPISYDAVGHYIDIIYEEHYKRYREEFGKTIKGFFIDEPRFGSAASYETTLGKTGYVYPWSEEVMEALEKEYPGDAACCLPFLWSSENEVCRDVQYAYMNVVSKLFARDFTGQIGNWCRSHGVKVIGHIVEDNGAHARLGFGPGHYFRSMEGFDTAGLDVVYQVWPEYKDGFYTTPFGYLDSEFFYWGLSKMASSAAHLDPAKKGITICEIFGAYGWQEGLKLMKWLTDHVCVRGINVLVPHAFSPKYQDPDCPPHFYARGENPQWKYFRKWSDYANRVCHLLSGGTHRATAAVLYHAEAEWGGRYQPFEKAVRRLMESQIDCDVIPGDCFADGGGLSVEGGRLHIGDEYYDALIVPYAQCLPGELLSAFDRAAKNGVPVLFVDDFPEHVYYEKDSARVLEELQNNPGISVCALEKIADWMKERGFTDIRADKEYPDLRFLHYEKEKKSIYFFTNESKYQTVMAEITLKEKEGLVLYDAMEDKYYPAEGEEKDNQFIFELVLAPYQSVFLLHAPEDSAMSRRLPVLDKGLPVLDNGMPVLDRGIPVLDKGVPVPDRETADMEQKMPDRSKESVMTVKVADFKGAWRVCVTGADGEPEYLQDMADLVNISAPDILPGYSGTICYEKSFFLEKEEALGDIFLDLGEVYEVSEVSVNGVLSGIRICPPYTFELAGCTEGENKLLVKVTNTLAKERLGNIFDRAMPQEPSGLLGPVRLYLSRNSFGEQ